ncbi:MAG TPA: inositol monophosphatase family protein [Rhodopila sp.]|uniref:inositol monophosphatase family protein n=1 Tax=Rhodopila sp. TaxID=2480087 RepID=UPI002C69D53F|nr:inositol monophosphatase family protein [Rhodopila sp.]HVY16520.1 inositol monophosphatase family protein [Rhodopila sp.]
MQLSADDVSVLTAILAQAAQTEILPRFKSLQDGDVRMKTSVFDPVTEADEAAERAISAAIRSRWPGALIVGEEATAADPSLLTQLADAELAFVVDPIDGTRNFVAGLPLFGVMAAAIVRGTIVAGIIHDPICGDTAHALKGQGAWMSRPGQDPRRLHVAQPAPVSRMEAFAGTNYLPEPLRARVLTNLPKLGSFNWLRCSAHEYRTASAGFCHVLLYNRLMPWDHAPGWLIHQEAGGYSAHFDGSAYVPAHTSGGLICAPDAASWQAVRDALIG